jgi:hypothetical protein
VMLPVQDVLRSGTVQEILFPSPRLHLSRRPAFRRGFRLPVPTALC